MSLTSLPDHFPRPTAPLMIAAVAGDATKVGDLGKAGGAVLDEYTEEGFSALIYASLMGHVQVVETLLALGAEVNPPPGKHTAVRGAGNYGHHRVVELLMAAGADVNIQSLGNRTPLMGAAMNGHVEITKIFLEAGADLSPVNDFGETALAVAKAK
eukprot:5873443-Pyramimonas_sp.AAC.2